MFAMIGNIMRRIIRVNQPNDILLGRWTVNHCEKVQEIKANWANVDHCGDQLCGFPSDRK